VYPITSIGRVLGAFIAIMGVGIFALPAGIIASGFEAEISKKSEKKD
jgi:voltage-gated potassium channel